MPAQEGLRKPPLWGCMKESIVFHSVAEVIIQLKYCMQLLELHKKTCGLLGKGPEGGTAGGTKHLTCRVMWVPR